jgi:FkbM family methyltransferase
MSISNIFIRIFEQNYLKYFGKAKYTTINYRLHKLFSKCLGINNFENSAVSGEKWVVNYLLPHYGFRNNAVFFDVGANVGDYSKEVIASYPGTQAFLFEPHPQTFQKLENESALKAARKFNIAFGEKLEKINFYDRSDISGGSSHASFYKEVISGIHNQNPVGFEVEVKTLDSFCSDYNILKIDFLKIDTEGHELAVLKGAKNLIAQQKIQLIQFEFNEMNVVSRTYMRDFVELLSNYQLHRVVPDGYFPLNNCVQDIEIFGFQNILAIPQN